MYKCPNCNKSTIPILRKLFIGTKFFTANCKQCGKKVKVSLYHSGFISIPFIIAILSLNLLLLDYSLFTKLIVAILLSIIWVIIYLRYAPLVSGE